MELCSDGHGEMCYKSTLYSSKCPACEAIQEKQDEIDKLTSEIEDLNAQIEKKGD